MTEGRAAGDEQAPNLTRTTLGGLSWTLGARILGLVAQLAYTSVMARLLAPELFGLVASAQVVLLAGTILSELGVGRAVVQKDTLSDREIRAAFTAAALLGALLTALMALSAPAVALLFDDPAVTGVTRGLSLVLICTTIGVPAQSVLLREMRFKASALIELGAFVIGYLVVGIGAAMAGAGVWSLVAAAVAKAVLLSVGGLVVARHPMRPLLAWDEVRSLYAFGGMVSVVSVVEYLTFALPPTAIGRFQGPVALGQFNQGNRIVDLPFTNLSLALGDVLLPAVARIKHERDRVAGAYLSVLRITGGLLLPAAAGLAVAAPEVVRVVLGDQWGPAAQVLPLLAFHATSLMLTYYAAVLCEALGVLRPKLVIQTITLGALWAGLVALRDGGLVRAVAVMLVAQVLRMVLYWVLMARETPLTVRAQVGALLGPAAGAVLAALVIAGVTQTGRAAGLPAGALMPLQVGAGGLTLVVAALWGPLGGMRDDLVQRLVWSGITPGDGLKGRVLRLAQTGQRTPPEASEEGGDVR